MTEAPLGPVGEGTTGRHGPGAREAAFFDLDKTVIAKAEAIPTTSPRVTPPKARANVSSCAVSGGISVSTMFPCTLEMIIDEDGSAVGSIDAADLPVGEDAGLASLLETLAHASSVEALRDVRNAARRLARGALAAGADVVEASRLLTAVSDRTVRVLLVIAHRELGPAPSDYAWLVFGRHARRAHCHSRLVRRCLVCSSCC